MMMVMAIMLMIWW